MTQRLFSCLLALALVLQPALGQTAAPPAPPAKGPQQEGPAVRVTTRLVQVSVVVQDRKGKPVDGLQRDDFQLFEDGKPQAIQMFAVEKLELAPATAPPPPGTFSNYLDARGNRPNSVTVILLDGLNTQFMDMASARPQIIKFLRQLKPGDRIALYLLGNRLRILHDFTTDAEVLLRALDRDRADHSVQLEASQPEVADSGDPELDAFLNEANQRIAEFYTTNRVQRTLAAIETIANHLAGFQGRKNLVWVSGSFPIMFPRQDGGIQTFSNEMNRTVRALNAADVAIYPVDARGLMGLPAFNAAVGGRAVIGRAGQGGGMAVSRANIDTMQELAADTGGRAFYNTNDIQGAIRRAIDDSQISYILGYYPAHGEWTGKYHRIKVKGVRPGMNVRYRQGYHALPEPEFTPNEGERMMRAAAWNPLDATGLRIAIRAKQFHAAGADRIKLDMRFVPQDIRLSLRDGYFHGTLQVSFVQRTNGSTVYSTRIYKQELRISEKAYQGMLTSGMTLSRDFDLLPDADLVMVLVRDASTGQMGSVRIPLSKLPKEGAG